VRCLRGKPWSPEEERQLRNLEAQGLNANEIGLRMNKKPNSVYEKARRIGLTVGISRRRKKTASSLAGNCVSGFGAAVDKQPNAAAAGLEENPACQAVGCSGFKLSADGGLPSVEAALKALVAAVDQLDVPGLKYDETQRLRTIINGVKTYKELFADFLNYKELENRMVELGAKYSELVAKTKNLQL